MRKKREANEAKRKRLTPEIREAIRTSDPNMSITEAAAKFGVAPSSIQRWRGRDKPAYARTAAPRAAPKQPRQTFAIDAEPSKPEGQLVCIMGSAEQIRAFLAQR